jgi:hypothetical protein
MRPSHSFLQREGDSDSLVGPLDTAKRSSDQRMQRDQAGPVEGPAPALEELRVWPQAGLADDWHIDKSLFLKLNTILMCFI